MPTMRCLVLLDRVQGPMSFVTIERAVLYQLIELAARAARTMDDVAVVDYAAIVAARQERESHVGMD